MKQVSREGLLRPFPDVRAYAWLGCNSHDFAISTFDESSIGERDADAAAHTFSRIFARLRSMRHYSFFEGLRYHLFESIKARFIPVSSA